MTEAPPLRSVSIIIATFNAGELIDNCLLSIFSQTHPEIEIIVVDGGSTDRTLTVLQNYSNRLKWTSERDRGLNDAQWKGVLRASNEWILFLGADDVLASPKALENLLRKCPEDLSPYDILTGHALYEDGRLSRSRRPELLRMKNTIHGQGALYRRRLFAERGYDMTLRVYYDYEFNLWAYTSGKQFFHTDVLLSVLGCGGHSDRPRWRNYLEDMRTRARYVKGPFLLATNIVAVGRYLYKVAWFRFVRHV
jgi:glycosyltransferase involved in cell wall biosynthesis